MEPPKEAVVVEPVAVAPLAVERIDDVLTRLNGDRGDAAKFLKITKHRLEEKINADPTLRNKWKKVTRRQTEELAIVEREANLEIAITESEQQLAAAIAKEDAKLKKGVESLGFDEAQAQFYLNVTRFHGGKIETVTEFGNGGLTMIMLELLEEIRNLKARLKTNSFTKNTRGDPSEEAMIRASFKGLLEEYRKSVELSHKGAFLSARIEGMRRQANINAVGEKKNKPGFRPKGDVTNVYAQQAVVQTGTGT